ncbi:hypothetical protein DVA67_022910 [Solirubrobacter sp. CPCC 204708]|uniref:Calcium-binding protein n=1 Tax=Solirubrobacter deserti TaxID=2282478 RepID=A0ABT4RI39_9ACTN|nr:hypothetical protein [Solirubrobacter deserti]MBE2318844.1 hypothetical protein [Solirubrobacter deserti]MDA0138224.1 hypothetical protein [Solirubrobacter deserti]
MFRATILTVTLTLSIHAAAARASTIGHDAGGWTFAGAPGERNALTLSEQADGALRFSDDGASITVHPPGCTRVDVRAVSCPPAPVRVALADGNDTFGLHRVGAAFPLTVDGGDGDDQLTGDILAKDKTFLGGPGNDLLDGASGNDVLRGGAGNDILWGDAGADQLHGEDGDDQLKPDNGKAPAPDFVDGGPGIDKIDDWVELAASTYPRLNVTLDGVADDGRPGEGDNIVNVEKAEPKVSGHFVLTDGPDDWYVMANLDSGASTILAGGGNDRIVGEDAAETIDGGAGDDYLEGGRRSDVLRGGPGRDLIVADESEITCVWGPDSCLIFGDDVIDARDGERDEINCGPGTDRLTADPVDAHLGCESVDTGGAAPGPVPTGDGSTPTLGLKITRVKLGKALRDGLRVKLTGTATGTITVRARRGKTVVAKGSGRAGTTVRVKFTKAAKTKLRRVKTVTLTVSAGAASTTLKLRR